MVGEAAVGLEVAAHRVDLGQALEHRLEHAAAHAVGRVHDHAQRLDRARVDEGEDALEEGRPDVLLLHGALASDLAEALQSAVANVHQAGVASHR